MSEKKLQSQMVIEFSQAFPELRGRLFATFSETISASQGANRLSLGLVRGTSDLIYIDEDFYTIGIEIKKEGTRHNAQHVLEQCDWLENCCYRGYFCTSVDMFWNIIQGGNGISPEEVRERCEGKKTVTF